MCNHLELELVHHRSMLQDAGRPANEDLTPQILQLILMDCLGYSYGLNSSGDMLVKGFPEVLRLCRPSCRSFVGWLLYRTARSVVHWVEWRRCKRTWRRL